MVHIIDMEHMRLSRYHMELISYGSPCGWDWNLQCSGAVHGRRLSSHRWRKGGSLVAEAVAMGHLSEVAGWENSSLCNIQGGRSRKKGDKRDMH